jgi:hypothetical protein
MSGMGGNPPPAEDFNQIAATPPHDQYIFPRSVKKEGEPGVPAGVCISFVGKFFLSLLDKNKTK